jgi:hypothetical protein
LLANLQTEATNDVPLITGISSSDREYQEAPAPVSLIENLSFPWKDTTVELSSKSSSRIQDRKYLSIYHNEADVSQTQTLEDEDMQKL